MKKLMIVGASVLQLPAILTIKPGITGYNQAYFRNSIDGAEKMKMMITMLSI